MIKPAPPKPRGIAGVLLIFCIAGGIAGLGFDLLLGGSGRFSVAAEPGARAVLGIGVAVLLVLVAHVMRLVLGRKPDAEGMGDVRDHT
jgi:hypothetical protein